MMFTYSKKLSFYFSVICVVVLGTFIPSLGLYKPVLASASWYNQSWTFRKQMALVGSSSALSNYQMRITVHRTTGTDSSSDVYLDTKVNADYSDLRFTKSDGISLLPYWIETPSSSSAAAVWVNFDSIPQSSTANFYLYYGNSSATDASDGTNTFVFFDDFNDGNFNTTLWSQTGSYGSTSESNGTLTITSGNYNRWVYSNTAYGNGYALRARVKQGSATSTGIKILGFITATKDPQYEKYLTGTFRYSSGQADFTGISGNGNSSNAPDMNVTSDTNYHVVEAKRYASGGTNYDKFTMDDGSVVNGTYPTSTARDIIIKMGGASGETIITDWVALRNYVVNEPTWGTWGSEENLPSILTITTTSPLTSGTVGTAYSATLAASGGTPPYTWSLSAGALPAGLNLNSSSGAITGTPTVAGTTNFTAQVADSASGTATKQLAITVTAALTITTTSPLPDGILGTAYSATLAASGGTIPYTWSVSAGALPAGLSLNSGSGSITGTPTAAGTTNFTAQVADSASGTTTKQLAITVNAAPLTITTTSLPNGALGTAYSTTLAASGGTPPYTWSLSAGALPAGLNLNSSSGAITGTPTENGTTNFTAQVTDNASGTTTKSLTLTVNPPLIVAIAGWRSSDYGIEDPTAVRQGDASYWISVAQQMAAKFPGSAPGGVYTVGYTEGSGTAMPYELQSTLGTMTGVTYDEEGVQADPEVMLTAFDNAGLSILLGIEPGNADTAVLADKILNKYKHHPCVKGMSMDVEWYMYPGSGSTGTVTLPPAVATAYKNAILAVDPSYKVVLKHFFSYRLPAGISGVTYLTDTCGYTSREAAVADFVAWADSFTGSEIGYQFGYDCLECPPDDDTLWWKLMGTGTGGDPALLLIQDIKAQRPTANIYCVYWADFTISTQFPYPCTETVLNDEFTNGNWQTNWEINSEAGHLTPTAYSENGTTDLIISTVPAGSETGKDGTNKIRIKGRDKFGYGTYEARFKLTDVNFQNDTTGIYVGMGLWNFDAELQQEVMMGFYYEPKPNYDDHLQLLTTHNRERGSTDDENEFHSKLKDLSIHLSDFSNTYHTIKFIYQPGLVEGYFDNILKFTKTDHIPDASTPLQYMSLVIGNRVVGDGSELSSDMNVIWDYVKIDANCIATQ